MLGGLTVGWHPGLNQRAGISGKWEVARGPGQLIASGMTGIMFNSDSLRLAPFPHKNNRGRIACLRMNRLTNTR